MDFGIFNEFVTLATYRNYVSAARDLNMSQPSLSRHIDALEKHLKQKLFYDSRPLSLTAAGEIVLKYSGKLIRDYSDMTADLDALSKLGNERILVQDLLHANALYHGMKEGIALTKKAYPGLRVDYINTENSGLGAYQLLERGKIDISFDTTITYDQVPSLDNQENITSIWVPEFHGQLVVGIPKDNELCKKEYLSLADMARQRFILPANRHSDRFKEDFVSLCRDEGFYPNLTFVPSNNAFEFYSTDPGDGIHLLAAVDKGYHPLLATILKEHVTVKSLKDKQRYTNAFMLVRNEEHGLAFESLISFLKDRARQASSGGSS